MLKKIKKILVPLDGSKDSIKGLDYAISIAKATDAVIFGIHVIHVPAIIKRDSVRLSAKSQKQIEKILDDAKNRSTRHDVEFEQNFEFGENIGKHIVNFAHTKKFDLIVIGSRGPDTSADMFIGSVANYVLLRSKIPVLMTNSSSR